MAQWISALAPKPDDLSLLPGAHMVEGDRLRELPSDSCMHVKLCACPTPNKCLKKFKSLGLVE